MTSMTWVSAFVIFLCAVPATATADIYRYVNDDGVTCFTDSPTHRDAEMIVREARPPRARKSSSVPMHLTAAGIADKLGKSPKRDAGAATAYPVPPLAGRVTSTTGLRHDPIDGKLRHHNGFDIAVPTGTPVKAVSAGTVVFSGNRPGYGNMIIIDHGDGTITVYAHNSVNLLGEHSFVDQGTIVALSGSTGRSTGPHLHFEAWKDGVNITSTFMPGASMPDTPPGEQGDAIVRTVASDGSILFTNMR